MINYEKEYNEALERAKKLKETCDSTAVIGWCEYIFPSLKESEGEKIRKELIDYLKERKSCESYGQYVLRYNRWINWLEKQGEQKPADKVESKFKIRDWVVYNRTDHSREVMQIYDIRDNRYYFNDNTHFSWSVKECDEKSHLWSIKEAKEGDVLATESGRPFIVKGFLDKLHPNSPVACCGIDNSDNFYVCVIMNRWTNEKVYPATKEQCDTLFARMKEDGYQWDKNKKEVIKL